MTQCVGAGLPQGPLTACELPHAWADQAAWTILDTDFQSGERFLQTWQAWRSDPQRPPLLHYVGIANAPPAGLPVDTPAAHAIDMQHALALQCQDLGSGFRRMCFDAGRISLTLCVGSVSAMLREHVFQADTVFTTATHDKWLAQLLARRCKRGTRIGMPAAAKDDPMPTDWLREAGFEWDAIASSAPHPPYRSGRFNPRWTQSTSRSPLHIPPSAARCAIVGAGISGASVAHALALRGWQVTVFDQESAPARGASGLPAGLAVPHVSADDNPRSRLSRNGTRLTMQHAAQHLNKGQDWAPSGVVERKPGAAALWHPQAAWIKPAALVQAWLAHPSIRFIGQTQVGALHREGCVWNILDTQQQALGSFELVVVANAMGAASLLKPANTNAPADTDLCDKLNALQAVHGTLSHGTYAEPIADLPATPVNGNGCFIPCIPGPAGDQWAAGSSFETDALAATDIWTHHAANMARLQYLLPDHTTQDAAHLAQTLDRGPVSLWSATRCVTHDRLPLVGPVNNGKADGLWACLGMGSRGLSFAALCAELLVARLGGEPLPVEFSLSRSLDIHRTRRMRNTEERPEPGSDHTF